MSESVIAAEVALTPSQRAAIKAWGRGWNRYATETEMEAEFGRQSGLILRSAGAPKHGMYTFKLTPLARAIRERIAPAPTTRPPGSEGGGDG